MSFDDISDHELMLKDEVRTRAYERAIERVVRPGARVLDFGCGSGILSFFAARAGAERVYAVDESPFIRVAEALAKKNGFDNITFLKTDGGAFALPEKVDVIVSEWMGRFVFRDMMLDALLRARDAHLAPGGVMVPRLVRPFAALAALPELHDELAFFDRRPYGLDLSPVRDWPFDRTVQRSVDPSALLCAPVDVGAIDVSQLSSAPKLVEGTATMTRDGLAHAIVGWFEAELADDVVLATGPSDPTTHWKQLVFPLRQPLALVRGATAQLQVRPLVLRSAPHWAWSVRVGSNTVWGDDFSYQAFVNPK